MTIHLGNSLELIGTVGGHPLNNRMICPFLKQFVLIGIPMGSSRHGKLDVENQRCRVDNLHAFSRAKLAAQVGRSVVSAVAVEAFMNNVG